MTSRHSRFALATFLGLLIVSPGCHQKMKPESLGPQNVQLTNNGPGGSCAQNGSTNWVNVHTGDQAVVFIASSMNTTLSIQFSGTCPFSSCPVAGTGSVNAGTINTAGDYPYSAVVIGGTTCPNVGGGSTFGLRVRP